VNGGLGQWKRMEGENGGLALSDISSPFPPRVAMAKWRREGKACVPCAIDVKKEEVAVWWNGLWVAAGGKGVRSIL
jgi:hypothetical protein